MSTILCFDLGLKRTGVAVGQTLLNTAHAAGQLKVNNGRFNWTELDQLIIKWQPEKIIIGNPKSTDPHLNKLINRFKSHIQHQHKISIVEVDEELTSAAANLELQNSSLTTSKKIKLRDQIAACLILESYFFSHKKQ